MARTKTAGDWRSVELDPMEYVGTGVDPAVSINDTGIIPVEYKCVVRVVEVEKKTAGGVIIPDVRRERDQMAMTTATLLEAGGNAFEDWKGRKPEPGDQILIQKYAGQFKEADATDPVRVVQDKEILAILDDRG